MKIFILGSYGPSLINFRGDMIKAMIQNGHEVIACSPNDTNDIERKIADLGAKYIPIDMNRTGMNPLKDLNLIREIVKVLKREQPDVFLSYTIKPNIYGTLAAYFSEIEKIYAMMTGAGSVIRSNSKKMKVLHKFLMPLYKMAFKKCDAIFFLNSDDLLLFKEKGIIRKEKVEVIGSSGVNLDLFENERITNTNTFLFIARLIKDKGIFEFLEAAIIAKKKRPNMKFEILGPYDTNPTAITPSQLNTYITQGIIEYHGSTDDVRPFIKNSFVVVLPSYHEGQGRVLVEAMAIGRAVIATDVPGCRQTVVDGVTGFLVPAKNSNILAEKMIDMFDSPDMTKNMAEKGFERASEFFDVNKINDKLMELMKLKKN